MSSPYNQHHSPTLPPPDYERSDTRPSRLILIILLSVLGLILILIALNEFFILYKEKVYYQVVLSTEDPDLVALKDREKKILSTYEIADSSRHLFRIPIEEAMRIMVQERGTIEGKIERER